MNRSRARTIVGVWVMGAKATEPDHSDKKHKPEKKTDPEPAP